MNKIKIANLEIKSQVALAPMAGITDYVLRNLIREHSKNSILYTEMISSEALMQVPQTEILKREPSHSPIIYQLSGHKPEMMAKAAQIIEPLADVVDINMGCPVNKVVKGQDGCALMRNPQLAIENVKAIKSVINKPLSVKFRLGYTASEMNFVEYGQQMQNAGADFIMIHGRTRAQMYSGEANWEIISKLKENVDIPVFANGDIISVDSAIECLEKSKADGIGIGRGVLGDVTLMHRIEHYLETGVKIAPPTLDEKIETMKIHLNNEMELRGENVGLKFCRKFYPYYIRGVEGASQYRFKLVTEDSYDEVIKLLDGIKDRHCVKA